MVLNDKDIHKLLETGDLVVLGTDPAHPFKATDQVQPCSIDLRLGNRFLRFKADISEFDIENIKDVSKCMEEEIVPEKKGISLSPNGILFGQVYEQLRLPPKYCGHIEGRSRFARLGLSVHVTGGFINPEFEGSMPLQIVNNNAFPIIIYPYITICQLLLTEISDIPLIPYPRRSNNPYHRESNASPSVISTDPELDPEGTLLPNLNKEIEERLLNKYLDDLKAQKEKQRMIDAFSQSADGSGHTINITHSNVGVLNTGTIGNIDVSIKALIDKGEIKTAEAISQVSNAINSSSLDQKSKGEAGELLSAIAQEAGKTRKNQGKIVLSTMADKLGRFVTVSESITKVWNQWKPILEKLWE